MPVNILFGITIKPFTRTLVLRASILNLFLKIKTMKNKIMKKKSIYEISKYSLVLVLTMLVMLSCSDDNSEISQAETIKAKEG